MSFQITAARSSRVNKNSSKNPLARGSKSSPFKARAKQRPKQAKKQKDEADEDDDDELFDSPLENHGLITTLVTDLRFRDVAQQLQYVQASMFDEIPERAGMNSTRIAEVLTFRKNLPPVVSAAHVHALSKSPTETEREIAELVHKGIIRKVSIPGRGLGSSSIGECLVLTERWVEHVEKSGIDASAKAKYIQAMRERPGSQTIPASYFEQAELSALNRAGYLTFVSASTLNFSSGPSTQFVGTLQSISTAGSRAAAGSVEAVGGNSAIYDAGGGGSALSVASKDDNYGPEVTFTLPSVGTYLRLLEQARNHLVELLAKCRFKQAPKTLLRERWDGSSTRKQRARGLEKDVLPAKTKRWKQFYGLRFEWILAECMGSGMVEVFDTGSVGHGVKIT